MTYFTKLSILTTFFMISCDGGNRSIKLKDYVSMSYQAHLVSKSSTVVRGEIFEMDLTIEKKNEAADSKDGTNIADPFDTREVKLYQVSSSDQNCLTGSFVELAGQKKISNQHFLLQVDSTHLSLGTVGLCAVVYSTLPTSMQAYTEVTFSKDPVLPDFNFMLDGRAYGTASEQLLLPIKMVPFASKGHDLVIKAAVLRHSDDANKKDFKTVQIDSDKQRLTIPKPVTLQSGSHDVYVRMELLDKASKLVTQSKDINAQRFYYHQSLDNVDTCQLSFDTQALAEFAASRSTMASVHSFPQVELANPFVSFRLGSGQLAEFLSLRREFQQIESSGGQKFIAFWRSYKSKKNQHCKNTLKHNAPRSGKRHIVADIFVVSPTGRLLFVNLKSDGTGFELAVPLREPHRTLRSQDTPKAFSPKLRAPSRPNHVHSSVLVLPE